MIKNIVLDMGGVCLNWDPVYLAKELTDDESKQDKIIKYLFQSKQWQMMDGGLLTSEEALEIINKDLNQEDQELITYAMNNWYYHFNQLDDMYKLVTKLNEEGYKIYLLSNCSKQFNIYYKDRDIFKLFDDFYLSCDSKLLKPDAAIYEDFLHKFNLEADECVFVDDMEVNAIGATNVGMHGYFYQRDVDALYHYIKNIV